MAAVGLLLTSLFVTFFQFFAQIVSRKIAVNLTIGAMIGTGFVVLAGTVHGMMAVLTVSMPYELGEVLTFFFPGNVNTVIAAVIAVEVVCANFSIWKMIMNPR